MAISKRLRYEILRRDNHQCRYCGSTAPDAPLVVDHVIPVALGGLDDPSNLVTACRDCNAGKSASSPDAPIVADVSARALRWAEAMRIAAEERAAAYAVRVSNHEWFRQRWESWSWQDSCGVSHTVELPSAFGVSLDQFLAAGLTREDIVELIEVTMSARTADEWTYFCGCCWRRIRQANERAAELIEEAESGA